MRDSILNDLDELLSQQIITNDEAARIRDYYGRKPKSGNNRLVIIFGVFGSLLVGMGLVLIIAHNWDNLMKPIKLSIALFPLLAGQAICGYLLRKKSTSAAWREGASVFVVFAVATAIAIVSQVYNVMQSSAVSLLFWMGITWYACEDGYFHFDRGIVYKYWILAFAALPFYWLRCKHAVRSNVTTLHHWVIAGSLIITLGTFTENTEELMMPAYIFLFGIFVLIGQLPALHGKNLFSNAYLVAGSLGSITMLLMLSFDWYWDNIQRSDFGAWLGSPELFLCLFLIIVSAALYVVLLKRLNLSGLLSKSYVVPAFLVLFILGVYDPHLAQILVNLFVLILAVYTIREGAQADHLGRMNYGLMILTLLIICRFFDTDLTFVVRGLLFVMVGLGFFAMNYRMIKKRREQQP
jgi:Predicted membrane protein (DUF2157)